MVGQVWSPLATKLLNQSTNVAYWWKAYLNGYPSIYKNPYHVSQIKQFLRFKQNSAWKFDRKLWSSLPSKQSTNIIKSTYRWKGHFTGYFRAYKLIHLITVRIITFTTIITLQLQVFWNFNSGNANFRL